MPFPEQLIEREELRKKNDESSVYAMKVIKKKNMISKGRIQETKNELKILYI